MFAVFICLIGNILAPQVKGSYSYVTSISETCVNSFIGDVQPTQPVSTDPTVQTDPTEATEQTASTEATEPTASTEVTEQMASTEPFEQATSTESNAAATLDATDNGYSTPKTGDYLWFNLIFVLIGAALMAVWNLIKADIREET